MLPAGESEIGQYDRDPGIVFDQGFAVFAGLRLQHTKVFAQKPFDGSENAGIVVDTNQ